jgi:putative DNA primase/helicase
MPSIVSIIENAPPLPGSAPMPPRELQDALAEAFEAKIEAELPPKLSEVEAADLDILAACAKLELNDTGNGARMLLHFGRDLQHVREIGWHTWTGRVWQREGGDEAAIAYAQRTAKRIHGEVPFIDRMPHEAKLIRDAEPLRLRDRKELTAAENAILDSADAARRNLINRRDQRQKHATTSGNGGRITAMIAQALPHKSVGPKELDADHMMLNCENGTLVFAKEDDPDWCGEAPRFRLNVKLEPHNRARLITKIAPISCDPSAECPRFAAFMERFQPNPDVRRFLQVYHGLALTGLTGQQCFIYNYGTGANGKSTFMETIASMMGNYADLLNAESLTGQGQRRGDQATPDFAELPGVRYLRISELPRGEDLKEALVKSLTGGEEIKARHLNKGFFKFTPTFKAAMSGNDLPKIGGVDNGIWRRVRLVPWEVTIPEAERRPMNEILAEFQAERPGILNWLLEGLDLYLREGLRTPDVVTAATSAYREEMDPIGAFAADCLDRVQGHSETARTVYEAFVAWCEANSVRPWKETAFGRAMPQKGFERENKRVRRYLDVRLHDVPSQEPGRGSGVYGK